MTESNGAQKPSVLSLAGRFCELSGWEKTNLSLQKITYLTQMVFAGRNQGEALFPEHFEAWKHGPVAPELYDAIKIYGVRSVPDGALPVYHTDNQEINGLIDHIRKITFNKTPSELIAITHWENSAWSKNYDPRKRHTLIPLEDIAEEYHSRMAHPI